MAVRLLINKKHILRKHPTVKLPSKIEPYHYDVEMGEPSITKETPVIVVESTTSVSNVDLPFSNTDTNLAVENATSLSPADVFPTMDSTCNEKKIPPSADVIWQKKKATHIIRGKNTENENN